MIRADKPITVTSDLPDHPPVTAAEIELMQHFFHDLIMATITETGA